MDEIFANEEWRDKLVRAMGYRMHAMNQELSPNTARLQVRDFMKYGNSSQYAGAVMAAAFEMFWPMATAFAPIIRAAVTAVTGSVEREIENGAAIEIQTNE